MRAKVSAEDRVRGIRRKTRKKYSSEEKVRIVLEGLRGEESIAALCRREGIPSNLDYRWSKDFLEAGKKRQALRMARDQDEEAECYTSGVMWTSYRQNGTGAVSLACRLEWHGETRPSGRS